DQRWSSIYAIFLARLEQGLNGCFTGFSGWRDTSEHEVVPGLEPVGRAPYRGRGRHGTIEHRIEQCINRYIADIGQFLFQAFAIRAVRIGKYHQLALAV